ncbi:hypothetical protein [Azotobacter beijerinckii]|uniref:hypothetical protein n=1 Tax=Azotobacter beijerinckii TaxID=170623 RepID=UPI0011603D66|nr:hypothetical protein [Azotobacter beijerinckii]
MRKPLRQVRLGRRQLALDAIQLVLQVLDGLRRVGQLPLGLFALLAGGPDRDRDVFRDRPWDGL